LTIKDKDSFVIVSNKLLLKKCQKGGNTMDGMTILKIVLVAIGLATGIVAYLWATKAR